MSQLRSPSVLIIHFIFPHQVLDMSHLRSPSILILQSSASHIRSLITSPYVSALVTSAGSHFACFVPLILPRILTHLRALLSPFTSTYRKPCSHASSDAARLPSCHVFSLIVGPFSPPSCLPSAAFRSPAATPSTVLFPTSADSPFTSVTSAFHPVRPRVREMVTCLHATPSSLEADFAPL